ncbi:GNAT family N-acetyltransferase [Blastococcus sp. SYSU DS0617]
MTTRYAIRPVRAHEWREARTLRLAALADDVASVAFLTSHAEAAARSDEFWRDQTRGSSVDAGPAAAARLFVAVDQDGSWVGSVVALVERAGDTDAGGRRIEEPAGYVAAVYLAPEHRGRGLLGELLGAATGWLRERGLPRARLFVHTENPRARRAYEKAGFRATGVQITAVNGPELEMVKELSGEG